jgi:gamma-glutamyltranspeptidase/glutathione hydrolase
VASYDGRETAPASATPELFLHPDGSVMDWSEAAEGGLPVGVPGVVAMLAMAHADQGRLPWAELFAPAIALAEKGFLLSPRLYEVLDWVEGPERFPAFHAQFYTLDGARKAPGTRLTNPALAATLRALADGGAEAFYHGAIAGQIVAAVNGSSVNPGAMTLDDLAAYQAVRRDPVCTAYRAWTICGMGPPSSGGIAVAQILALLERFDMPAVAPGSLEAVHLIAEAERLAYADRDLFVADSDFVAVPVEALLDPAYLARRSALIDPEASMGTAEAGLATGDRAAFDDETNLGLSTSHISIVDMEGNAVSMTTSIERGFGSRLMAGGFLLNNELTDFSFEPEIDGQPVANRVEAGKRPRSSMAPTLVLDEDGRLVMAIGTVGGSRIICYVAKTLIARLDWGLDIQAAIELPHFLNRNGATELEDGTALVDLVPALEAMGHEVRLGAMDTGLAGFYIDGRTITGGADPRREGTALGR